MNSVIKLCMCLSLAVVSCSSTTNSVDNETNNTTTASNQSNPVIAHSRKASNYEILWESNDIRYDNAKCLFVLVEPISLKNDSFKFEIRSLISELAASLGTDNFSASFLDDREAAELFVESHYGKNTLGRILNKKELKKLERHSVAAYSGGLDNEYVIDFFPSAFSSSELVGKYVSLGDVFRPQFQ